MATTTSSSTSSPMVTGFFRTREDAERAYEALHNRGYSKDDVNLMMSDETRKKHFEKGETTELGSKALEGAGAGSAIGGTVGAIIAAIAAVGTSLAIPGLGLIIAGPLAAALAGAGAGGLAGGLVGALVGAGIPEDRAKLYEKGIRDGGIVMGVHPRSPEDAELVEREWKNSRGEHVYRLYLSASSRTLDTRYPFRGDGRRPFVFAHHRMLKMRHRRRGVRRRRSDRCSTCR